MNHVISQTTKLEAAGANVEVVRAKAGRPRAIGESLLPKVLSLYQSGLGYRVIACELSKQGIWVDWSTVRRAIKRARADGDIRCR